MQPRNTLSNGKIIGVLSVIFAGLHIPLGAIAVGRFALGYTDPMSLVICAFVGTLIAAALTLGLVSQQLVQRTADTHAR